MTTEAKYWLKAPEFNIMSATYPPGAPPPPSPVPKHLITLHHSTFCIASSYYCNLHCIQIIVGSCLGNGYYMLYFTPVASF